MSVVFISIDHCHIFLSPQAAILAQSAACSGIESIKTPLLLLPPQPTGSIYLLLSFPLTLKYITLSPVCPPTHVHFIHLFLSLCVAEVIFQSCVLPMSVTNNLYWFIRWLTDWVLGLMTCISWCWCHCSMNVHHTVNLPIMRPFYDCVGISRLSPPIIPSVSFLILFADSRAAQQPTSL